MKKIRKQIFEVIMLGAIMFPGLITAQNNSNNLTTQELSGQLPINTITTAVPFLMIAPDTRAGSMGDAGAATSPDANSIHWNPSKLAVIDKDMGFSLSYTPWLRNLVPDINLAYLSGYKRVDKQSTLGFSLLYFSLGNITFTDINGNTTGQFNPNEFAVDVAYARKLSEKFSGGLALRYIYSNLTGGQSAEGVATKAGMSVAADLSTYYQDDFEIGNKKHTTALGLNISNIGSKISYSESAERDFIPINMRLGGRYSVDVDKYNSIGITADINKLLVPTPPQFDSTGTVIVKGKNPDVGIVSGIFQSFGDAPGGGKEEFRELTYSAGLEYWYDKQFAIRAGYFHEHATKGNRKFLTFGAGLKYNVFGLDFAYLVPTSMQNSPLQNTLRFTLTFDFDAFKEQNQQEETPAE